MPFPRSTNKTLTSLLPALSLWLFSCTLIKPNGMLQAPLRKDSSSKERRVVSGEQPAKNWGLQSKSIKGIQSCQQTHEFMSDFRSSYFPSWASRWPQPPLTPAGFSETQNQRILPITPRFLTFRNGDVINVSLVFKNSFPNSLFLVCFDTNPIMF